MHADETEEPPGAVSNQMPEEGEAAHDGEGLSQRPPESEPEQDADNEGAAGEGSQSTGHPEGAG